MKILISLILASLLLSPASLAEELVVWERNFNRPFFKDTLQNILGLTDEEFGEITLVPSREMEQGRAFSELLKGNIDVFIAAADIERERLANVIYVPVDRGLLGFRICLVNKQAESFTSIRSPVDFLEKDFSVGLGSHWPDRHIYESNGFNVVTSPVFRSLFPMLDQGRFDCFSRSINEIGDELDEYDELNIDIDPNIVFIYPNSDFIFVSPNNPRLHRRLSVGMGMSIEDNSFYDIFDKHYEKNLIEHGVYQRRLLILKNDKISAQALSAINRFGIASFVTSPINQTAKE